MKCFGVINLVVPRCYACNKEMTYAEWREYFDTDASDLNVGRISWGCGCRDKEWLSVSLRTGGDMPLHKLKDLKGYMDCLVCNRKFHTCFSCGLIKWEWHYCSEKCYTEGGTPEYCDACENPKTLPPNLSDEQLCYISVCVCSDDEVRSQ